jgi:putative transposase
MDERRQFVAELCREFGISRKTGNKIFDRYQECGVHGLTDRSRRPYRYANQLPFQVENYILNVKREHPSWGARKIREGLLRRFSGIPLPAKSTVHAVLDRHGLVERRGRLRRRAHAAASVWVTRNSTSATSLPDRPSASKKFTMTSGWSALWIMIWDTLI